MLGYHPPRTPGGSEVTPFDAEMVELAMLLPRWQAVELELAAQENGLTPGQMVRRLIGQTLAARAAARG